MIPGNKDPLNSIFGAMAQLVAHLLCKQGVTGSNPVSSTIDTHLGTQNLGDYFVSA